MIYFKIGTIVAAALGLLIYTLLFDRKYFFPLLVVEIICTGILSFCIFYYIGSYTSKEGDALLKTDMRSMGEGLYMLHAEVKWYEKPEIFGFNGGEDMLVIRYDTEYYEMVSSNRVLTQGEIGKCLVTLPNGYIYSAIGNDEREMALGIKDGECGSVGVVLRGMKPDGTVKVFFLHDQKAPLEMNEYWEKSCFMGPDSIWQ